MSNALTIPTFLARLVRAPADPGAGGGAAGGAAVTTPPGDAPAGSPPSAANAPKWFEADGFDAGEREWLAAKGLTVDDPMQVLPKLVKGHRSAEQRIGKGLDTIMDRPAKDQKITEWMRANAATLGLPETEEGYAATPPEFWPKELPWDAELEGQARKIAFEAGVPPEAHQAYVGLFAQKMAALGTAAQEGFARANAEMMAELERDWGDQAPARVAAARGAFAAFAQRAGLGAEQLAAASQTMADKIGDANVIKLFAAIGAAMGEDRLVGLGQGDGLMMTPAQAKAAYEQFTGPEGEYGKAFAAGDTRRMKDLAARREQLARLATGG